MNKKTVFGIIGALAIIAAALMYKVGKSSSHLSELKSFWWVPLPLALICLLVAGSAKPKA
jgi:CDP-diglyceride synthetase